MKKHEQQLRAAIGHILLHDWDPIGVADESLAQDEYRSYISGVYCLIMGGASEQRIADHLHHIERVSMGISSVSRHLGDGAARKLRGLVTEALARPAV